MYREHTDHSALARLALGLLALSVPGSAVAQQCTPSLTAGFNGTPIPANSYLWFNSVLKVKLPAGTTGPVNLFLDGATLAVTPKGGTPTFYNLPSAQILYMPGATSATTTFTAGAFVTAVPASFGDNVFLTGLALPLPAGLPPGASATFSGTFTTDTPGVTLQYQFAAAVYKLFSTDYNALGVKPTHGGPDAYPGGDQAGTPENFARLPQNVIGGATGGGGGNFTGSYSATAAVTPCLAGVVSVS